jgi:thiamine biosynthesis lipoprotein
MKFTPRFTRRRFLLAAMAIGAMGRTSTRNWEWRGSALGAEARIVLSGPRDQAEAALKEVVAEIDRLENVFSLHRPGSQLSRLNSAGVLHAPSRDLRDVLMAADHWSRLTEGAFDPAIQPLWRYWAQGSGAPAEDGLGAEALARIRGTRVSVAADRVTLSPGAALTLNGIAQGTVTDRVAALLVRRGFEVPLIDTGEMRLPGAERRAVDLPEAGLRIALAEAAVATSAPGALALAATSRHHLFDPRNGDSPQWWRSLTVVAPTAEMADALSTGFAVSGPEQVMDISRSLADTAVIATDWTGRTRRYGAPRLLMEITDI